MTEAIRRDRTPNRILANLSTEDFRLLQPLLNAVDLPLRMQLETRNRRIEHVFFIEHGIASVVVNGIGQRSVEVGVVGREGVTGLAVIMQTDRSPQETFMQAAGSGLRMTATNLRHAMDASPTLHCALLQYGHVFISQMAGTVLANGCCKLEERLARWLLMAHDRADNDELGLTHEFLATMLAVRRPGVTVALNLFEKQGLIQAGRGLITILDRKGLEEVANGAYGTPETEFRRLFGKA